MNEPITTWKDLDKTFTDMRPILPPKVFSTDEYLSRIADKGRKLIEAPIEDMTFHAFPFTGSDGSGTDGWPETPQTLAQTFRYRLRLLWLALAHPEELEER